MIECQLLGPLVVSVDGGPPPAELMWRKHIGLFMYLAGSAGYRRSREDLIGLLWSDKPDSAARQSLRQAVHVLKRHVGADRVDVDAHDVRLAADAFMLDLLDVARREEAGDWSGAASLIRGDFAQGFAIPKASPFEEWLARERLRWRTRSVRILLAAAEQLLRDGSPEAAVDYAIRALDRDPGADAAASSAMKKLAIIGNRAGALEVYDRFVHYLSELGTVPAAETQALADRLRVGTDTSPATRDPLREEPHHARIPLVGRAAEIDRITTLAHRCRRESRCGALIIEGDSGTGKTRLSQEGIMRLQLDGFAAASARAIAAERDTPWSGVAALAAGDLLTAPGAAAAHPKTLAGLSTLAARVLRHFPSTSDPDPGIDPAAALQGVVAAICEEQPLVVVLDDAHWLDPQSLRAFVRLIRDLADHPLLLWLNHTPAHRRDEIEEARGWLDRDVPGAALALSLFSEADLAHLIDAVLPPMAREQRGRLIRRVQADSAGVPLLAVALLQALDAGLELREECAWPQPFRTLEQTLPADLPASVVGAVRVRFRRMSRQGQAVLRALAVVEGRVSTDRLREMVGLDGGELDPVLDELEWHGWLDVDQRGYDFAGRIVRDIIAQDLVTRGQRQRILDTAKQMERG